MDDAISLIVRSGGQPNDASEILEDEFLHSDVVDKAIGALAPVWQTLATNTARTLSRLSAPVQISLQDHVRQAREHGMTDRATRLQIEAESRANEGLEQDLQRLVGGQSLHQTLINVAGDMAVVRDALAAGHGGAGQHAPQLDGDALAELVAEKIANKQKRGGKKGPGARKAPRGPDKTDLKLLRALERSYPGDVRFGDINIAGLTVESTIWRRLNQLREAGLASSPRRGRWRIEPAGRALIVR